MTVVPFCPKDGKLRTQYPATQPVASGLLQVSSVHSIFWEEYGNPAGTPALFLHGGPGGGVDSRAHRFFDPSKYRVLLFCQRGCGKSTPLGCLTANTTWDLVSDVEALRAARGVDSFVVFGGSWGSTLALAYAQTHPQRVRALVLRGIFALRRVEVEWFYERNGAALLRPRAFARFVTGLPPARRCATSLVNAFHEVLKGADGEEATATAALAWSTWEGECSYFEEGGAQGQKYADPAFAAVFARIECHYFRNGGFFERDGFLLEKRTLDKIRHVPTIIVQGQWDLVCPIRTANDLHDALPSAEYTVVPDAGHSAYEPGITHCLVEATDRFGCVK